MIDRPVDYARTYVLPRSVLPYVTK